MQSLKIKVLVTLAALYHFWLRTFSIFWSLQLHSFVCMVCKVQVAYTSNVVEMLGM